MIVRRNGRRYEALSQFTISGRPVHAFRVTAGFTVQREAFVTLDICSKRSILSGFGIHVGEAEKDRKEGRKKCRQAVIEPAGIDSAIKRAR